MWKDFRAAVGANPQNVADALYSPLLTLMGGILATIMIFVGMISTPVVMQMLFAQGHAFTGTSANPAHIVRGGASMIYGVGDRLIERPVGASRAAVSGRVTVRTAPASANGCGDAAGNLSMEVYGQCESIVAPAPATLRETPVDQTKRLPAAAVRRASFSPMPAVCRSCVRRAGVVPGCVRCAGFLRHPAVSHHQAYRTRERVVVLDGAGTFSVSPLLGFDEAKESA